MPASLYDAHIHLANSSLLEAFGEVDRLYAEIGVRKVVCNGTSPHDWDTVLNLASKDPRIIPAIGLHPWKVNDAPENWQKQFLSALDQGAPLTEIALRFGFTDLSHFNRRFKRIYGMTPYQYQRDITR